MVVRFGEQFYAIFVRETYSKKSFLSGERFIKIWDAFVMP